MQYKIDVSNIQIFELVPPQSNIISCYNEQISTILSCFVVFVITLVRKNIAGINSKMK